MVGVSSVAIEVLLQNLISAVKEDYSLIKGLEKDAEQLQTTLEIIQGYLSDAEKKSITHDAVKVWLRKLEAVAFDADNVLDEFSYHLLHKKIKKMKTSKSKVLSCFSSLNSITRPRDMALQIKQITADFECMNKRATELSLQSLVVSAPSAPLNASSETNSFAFDPIFIGRDDEVVELVEKLTHFPQEVKFSILAIVGMGGMGKSTLTRKVFNDEKVKDRFGSPVWVHVSQTFEPIMLFKKILSIGDGSETEECVMKRLKEAWKGKSYLLVLDDVWNEDLPKWEHFINSISGVTSTNGNAIIITTRSDEVASLVRPFHTYLLKGLSDEECWSIIKAKAFENGEVPSGGFEMIGREIAKSCQHLPLAANVVGGVLRCKSEEEWGSINKKWVSDGEGGENIVKILKLSYDHLPSPSLKKCFAYCSIFPKGWRIERQEVIEQWMAEGFLQGDEMESVGDKVFNVFLHNSLLLAAERDDYGNVEDFVMHDLVHDMASSVLGYSNSTADGITPLRYLLLQQESPIPPKQVTKHLRALLFEGQMSGNMLEDMKYLHVLTLRGDYRVKELPNSIRKMIHLRNLNISYTSIGKLPEWIGELYHLQTLRAETANLRELPSTLKYLINLRHLYVNEWVELPAEIGRLIHLQTLRHFRVDDEKGYQIEELGSLKNIKGELRISNLEKVHGKEEALKANIFQKHNLFDLSFEWSSERGEGETLNDESVLEGLQPHPNLKKLGIRGFKGKRFPLWSEKMAVRDGPRGSNWVPLNNLIQIGLFDCHELEEIPMLEHLPNLKNLYLVGLKKVRFINFSFNDLISFYIEDLEGLEGLPHWLFYNNENLSDLTIWKCPKLRELPDGLHTLNNLKYLTIYNCQNLRSIGNSSGIVGQSQGILRHLRIEGCGGLMELPRQMVESWAPSLQILILWNLSSLENLPMLIDCLAKSTRLTKLIIDGVPKLMAACTVESWDLGSLRSLQIDVSKEWSMESSVCIAETVNSILQGCCNTLKRFTLKGSENWEWVPESIQQLTSLTVLEIKNSGVEELPQWFGNLSSLNMLRLQSCKKLRCLPSGNALENHRELLIDSEWRNIPHLTIEVDGRQIQSCSKYEIYPENCSEFILANVLIGTYLKEGSLEKAEKLRKIAMRRGAKPNAKTWEHYIDYYLEKEEFKLLLKCFNSAVRAGRGNGGNWTPSPEVVEKVMRHFEQSKDVEAAERFFEILKMSPNWSTDGDKLSHSLETSIKAADHPESKLFESLIRVYAAAGRKSPIMHRRVKMEKVGLTEEGKRLLDEISAE